MLYKSNFNRGWNRTTVEVGVASNVGLTLFANAVALSPQFRAFVRLSPGLLAEEKDIGFLSGFEHPYLKPILFDLTFSYFLTLAKANPVVDDLGNTVTNNFSFQIFSAF